MGDPFLFVPIMAIITEASNFYLAEIMAAKDLLSGLILHVDSEKGWNQPQTRDLGWTESIAFFTAAEWEKALDGPD